MSAPSSLDEDVPAEAACQRQQGVRRDGLDSFADDLRQGPGLGLADSPGDVAIVQKACRDRTTRLLAINQALARELQRSLRRTSINEGT